MTRPKMMSRHIVRVVILSVAILIAHLPSADAGTSSPGWYDIRDFGAVCDGVTDDAPAILAASTAAASGGGIVYFSPGNNYSVPCTTDTPISIPATAANQWVVWAIQNPLQINAPVTASSFNAFIGLPGYVNETPPFVSGPYASIHTTANPTFYVLEQTSVIFKNITIERATGGTNILVDGGSVTVSFDHVWSYVDPGATGNPLIIKGGFGFNFDGGGYYVGSTSSSPSILFEPNAVGNAPAVPGLVHMQGTVITGQGIDISINTGGLNGGNSFTFEDILYESGQSPFLTIDDGGTNLYMEEFTLNRIHMSDGNPALPVVQVNATNVHNMHLQDVYNGSNSHPVIAGQPVSIFSWDGGLVSMNYGDLSYPLWPNGSYFYCTDCQTGTTCAGGGTGAFAKKSNSSTFTCQ